MPTLTLPQFWPVTAPLLVPEDEDDRIQGWLSQYSGLWVSYTSEVEVDRGEFLAKYLTAVSYREHCTQWLDVRLCHYVTPHQANLIKIDVTPTLFGSELALTGAQAALYHPGTDSASILVQLDWLAQHKPTVDYKVSLRLLATNGSKLYEADDFPIGPLLPPTTWNAGDKKPGYVVLRLPPSNGEEQYRIELSVYQANSLAPLSHMPMQENSASGAPTTDPITLAEMRVGDTMQLLSPTIE
jgi:hypothetical protein